MKINQINQIQISITSISWKISKVYDIFATMESLYNYRGIVKPISAFPDVQLVV